MPPVFKKFMSSHPPQTIISLPVQTAVGIASRRGRVGSAGRGPAVGARIVFPAVVQGNTTDKSAPDDHLATGPDCRVLVSALGRVGGAGRSPTIHGWIVSPASVRIGTGESSPDDHLIAGPDCRTILSASGRVGCAGGCPTVGARIVSPAGVQKAGAITSAPDDHFSCQSTLPCGLTGQPARWWCWWLSNCRCWDCTSRRCSDR